MLQTEGIALEEIVRDTAPKSIAIMIEVKPDFEYGDQQTDLGNVMKIDNALDRLEDVPEVISSDTDIETYLVQRVPVKEGNASIVPIFALYDPKYKWLDIKSADLAFIILLNGKIQIVHSTDSDKYPPYMFVI